MTRGHGRFTPMLTHADEAARMAMQRLNDPLLCALIRDFTDGRAPVAASRPVFMLIRAMPSWDHETVRFLHLCQAVNAQPLIITMLADRFTSLNPDKYRRARMTFWFPDRTRVLRAGDMRAADGQPIADLKTRRGRSLAAFHTALLRSHASIATRELTDWLRPGGRSDYLHFFALCIAGAVLVEAVAADPLEQAFLRERMVPGWDRAVAQFGVAPLVTSHFTPAEIDDDFWWGYPGEAFQTAATLLNAA